MIKQLNESIVALCSDVILVGCIFPWRGRGCGCCYGGHMLQYRPAGRGPAGWASCWTAPLCTAAPKCSGSVWAAGLAGTGQGSQEQRGPLYRPTEGRRRLLWISMHENHETQSKHNLSRLNHSKVGESQNR